MKKNFKLEQCPFCGQIPKIEKRRVEERVDCKLCSYTSVGVWCNNCWFGLLNAVHNEENIEEVLQKNIQRWNTRV